jgi:hypothetical protein
MPIILAPSHVPYNKCLSPLPSAIFRKVLHSKQEEALFRQIVFSTNPPNSGDIFLILTLAEE